MGVKFGLNVEWWSWEVRKLGLSWFIDQILWIEGNSGVLNYNHEFPDPFD